MTLLIFVVVTAAVLGIAAYAVGRTAQRLAGEPPASLFEFDEAVEFVATALPESMSSRMSYGDVRAVIAAHLAELGRLERAGSDIVFIDETIIERVAQRPEVTARNLSLPEVRAVLDAEGDYLEAIGAVAAEADAEDDPPPLDDDLA